MTLPPSAMPGGRHAGDLPHARRRVSQPAAAGRAHGESRVRSHRRFALPFILFIPD
jgi:hypothetical protein